MDSLTDGFAAWRDRLSSVGVDAAALLNPPASAASIAVAERAIGHAFTDELRALYALGDGQRDIGPAMDATTQGPIVCPLFGSYDFAPLARAVDQYRSWQDVLGGWEVGSNPHEFITRRDRDLVAAEYWRAGWFPFAIDGGGNAYAADFAPIEGGTYGQVILFGPDEDERRVLALGLAALLTEAARRPIVWTEEAGNARFFELEDQLGRSP